MCPSNLTGTDRKVPAGSEPSVPYGVHDAVRGLLSSLLAAALGGPPVTPPAAPACTPGMALALQLVAQRWHARGVETCDVPLLEMAGRAHREALVACGHGSGAYETLIYLANLNRFRARMEVSGAESVCAQPVMRCGGVIRPGSPPPKLRCSPLPVDGEPADCSWYRLALDAYVAALELDPEGPHTDHAARGQLMMNIVLSGRRERNGSRACKRARPGA